MESNGSSEPSSPEMSPPRRATQSRNESSGSPSAQNTEERETGESEQPSSPGMSPLRRATETQEDDRDDRNVDASPAQNTEERETGESQQQSSPGMSPLRRETETQDDDGAYEDQDDQQATPRNPGSRSIVTTPGSGALARSRGTPSTFHDEEVMPTPAPHTPSSLERSHGSPATSREPNRGGSRRRELGYATTYEVPATHRRSSLHSSRTTPASDDTGTPNAEVQNEVIFGTDINIAECHSKLTDFIATFTLDNESEPLYVSKIDELHEASQGILEVDVRHLFRHDPSLYDQLVRFPTEVIGVFDIVVQDFWKERFRPDEAEDEDPESLPNIQTRPFGLRDSELRSMRELDPNNINQLVGIRGMVIRSSQMIPDLQVGYYRCSRCFHFEEVEVLKGSVTEPKVCAGCGAKHSFLMVHNRNTFADKQVVRLQEAPEAIPQGETPATLSVLAYGSLVDESRPGDRVEITGILRAVTVRVNPHMRVVRNIFRTYVDLVHMKALKGAGERGIGEDPDEEISLEKLEEGAQRIRDESGDIYARLSHSVAPSIWGMTDAKKGVLLQLFGGTRKDLTETGGNRFRGELHVLLVGDPGTSKSQILQAVNRLAPRGIYTSGRGSSAVGLTAYVTRDPETRDAVLESGALVLSDGGICCIDEFDKMSDHTRSVLHEAMEQQTVSIAKAGIVATLNARASVLAAANPIGSRYNVGMSVIENIDLPPALLSRFDLVFLILDQAHPQEDRRLAEHIVSLFHGRAGARPAQTEYPVKARDLARYIAYAREAIKPVLSPEASDKLIQGYLDMRGGADGDIRTIGATPRQLESLIRLAEAHARCRLSPVVEPEDADEAIRLMRVAIQQTAIDPRTGLIDMDLLMTGRSNAARQRLRQISDLIFETLTDSGQRVTSISDLLQTVRSQANQPISDTEWKEAIQLLREEQRIQVTPSGRIIQFANE